MLLKKILAQRVEAIYQPRARREKLDRVRPSGRNCYQIAGSQMSRRIAFHQEQYLALRHERSLLVRVRMVGIGRGPRTVFEVEQNGHKLASMNYAALAAFAKRAKPLELLPAALFALVKKKGPRSNPPD